MPSPQRRVALVLPWRTILKILAALVVVWLWFKLVELVLVLIVAVLLAVTLNPVVAWFERRKMRRGYAVFTVVAAWGVCVGAEYWKDRTASRRAESLAESIRRDDAVALVEAYAGAFEAARLRPAGAAGEQPVDGYELEPTRA